MIYDCATCEKQPALKVQLGHDGPPQSLYRENLLDGSPLPECPLRTVLRRSDADPGFGRELARYTEHYLPAYRRGLLLSDGGITDQPARYLAMIRALEDADTQSQAKFEELTKVSDAES